MANMSDIICVLSKSSSKILRAKKGIFYYTADGRIDFRQLVKDLAKEFKMRIEMRQVGVRDEAKMVGGLGVWSALFVVSPS